MQNFIFHIDVNSAFLSWSAVKQLAEEPGSVDLRTIPSAVGGDIEKRHGVITAKSIPAKKYGVKTGEPVVKALQKCPQLVLVKSDFKAYKEYSRQFISILRRYTDTLQQLSIDEAFLVIATGTPEAEGGSKQSDEDSFEVGGQKTDRQEENVASARAEAVRIAHAIKDEVRDTLGFTVNVGISTNKILAKTASDFQKPDRVHTLFEEEIPEKFWPLPIGDLYGCGPSSARRLEQMGIRTVGDAAHADLTILKSVLGEKGGAYIYESANGRGSDEVHGEEREAKGYSNETTTPVDIGYDNFEQEVPDKLKRLADSVSRRMIRDGVYASTIGVMVKTDDFKRHSRQLTLDHSVNDAATILRQADALLRKLSFGENGLITRGQKYRLIGVSATNLDDGSYQQVNLFEYMEQNQPTEKDKKLSAMMKQIREKYGDDAVHHGV